MSFSDTCAGANQEFQCWDGSCVAMGSLCDAIYDCPSYEDELNCVVLDTFNLCTSPSEFACFDGSNCLSYTQLCDGVTHCSDASDENGCNPPGPIRSLTHSLNSFLDSLSNFSLSSAANAATCPTVTTYDASSGGAPFFKVEIGPNTYG